MLDDDSNVEIDLNKGVYKNETKGAAIFFEKFKVTLGDAYVQCAYSDKSILCQLEGDNPYGLLPRIFEINNNEEYINNIFIKVKVDTTYPKWSNKTSDDEVQHKNHGSGGIMVIVTTMIY